MRAEPGLVPESRGWMSGLRSAASERDAVLARLHGLLLDVARHEAGRRNGWLRLSGPDRDDLARQAAADALRRSPCSSTASAARAGSGPGIQVRGVWRVGDGRPPLLADQDTVPGSRRLGPASSGLQPPERAERNELLPPLRRAVDEGLSGEQRTVFTAVTLHGVPTALAAALGSNRNAIYKALFQAGAASCAPAWQPIEEISRTFREPSGLVGPGWMICSPQTRGYGVRSGVPRTGPLRRS